MVLGSNARLSDQVGYALCSSWPDTGFLLYQTHRRMMEREAKAKVVVSVWGAEFIHFLAPLAVLHPLIWKKWLNSTGLFGRNSKEFN